MKKLTLHFPTLFELTRFSKTITGGYLLNTKNLTLTGYMSEVELSSAVAIYNATLIETTEKVYSYDML